MSDISVQEIAPITSPKTPSSPGQQPSEVSRLLTDTQIRAETEYNNWFNHYMSGKRGSEAALQQRDRHAEMSQRVHIAKELLGKEGALSPETLDFIDRGGSIGALLAEFGEYMKEGPPEIFSRQSDVDRRLAETRRTYVRSLLQRKGILKRDEKEREKKEAETAYVQAVMDKLTYIAATPPDQALDVGYLPQTIEKLSFGPDIQRSIADLAGSHMHVLVDMLLREQLIRAQLADQFSEKGLRKVVKAVLKNRFARVAIAGSIFTASAMSIGSGAVPDIARPIADVADDGLRYLTAYLASKELLEGTVEGITTIAGKRRFKKEKEKLAEDQELADLTLRTAYNEVEASPLDRKGTSDKKENLGRFDTISDDYIDLQTAPGSKPYSAEQMLVYCTRLYLKHKEKIDRIVQVPDPEKAYYDFASTILGEDITRMTDEVTQSRVKRSVFRALGGLSSIVVNQLQLGPQFVRTKEELVDSSQRIPEQLFSDLNKKVIKV